MADLELGVTASGVDEAVRELARVDHAQDEVARSAEASARITRAAAATTTRALSQVGAAATQLTNRAGQVAGAMGNVGSVLGQLSPSLGGVGSALGSVGTAASALAGSMGPVGVAIAGVTAAVGLLVPAIRAIRDQFAEYDAAAERSRNATIQMAATNEQLAQSYSRVLAGMRSVQRETAQRQRVEMGLGAADEQAALVGSRRSEVERLEAMERDYLATASGRGALDDRATASRAREEVRPLIRAARAALNEAISAQRQSAYEEETELMEELTAAANRGSESASSGGRPSRRRSRRAAVPAPVAEEARAPTADDIIGGIGDRGLDGFLGGQANAGAAQMAESVRAANELEEAQLSLTESAKEASAAFGEGWTDSLEQVRESWEEANRTANKAGTQMISRGRLMERSLVAVGNNIADTIGGTMTSAFEKALGAWLDGSMSFVEAAEEMVKGVIKALTIESIIQAVTEVARGISALARQDYLAAPQHFAAAAAWGAVAVVAGSVGAGIGAFGGGGGGDSASSQGGGGGDARALGAGSVEERERTENVTINVYPGGYLTRDEVALGVLDAVNRAGRQGGRIDGRLTRGGA